LTLTYKVGSKALSTKGYPIIGIDKSIWAEAISPVMDINNNASPSFCYFCDKLKSLAKD
jgi:hypothetical protein